MIACTKCGTVRKDARGRCSECRNTAAREWRANNKERSRVISKVATVKWRARHRDQYLAAHRAHGRKRKTGWTQAEFDAAWAQQSGRCAICNRALIKNGVGKGVAHADHDHVTKQKRGLLCSACNCGIGYLQDSTLLLLSAIVYLRKWRGA
jgi:hypothetical protein